MILLLAASIWLIALLLVWSRRASNDDAWRDVLAIGVIGAATAGFFWRVIFGGAWMPAGGGDLAQFLYPTYRFAAEWWRRGILPLWNPHLFAGMPFVGDIQSGIFYPINLLAFFVSSPLAFRDMEFLSILHFFIAGAGMYALLRWGEWRVTSDETNTPRHTPHVARLAALAGASAFEFSDLFITHFGNLNLIATIAWTPLILLFYQRAVTDRRASFAIIAGILLALAFHAGHIQMFLFALIALGLLSVFEAARIAHPASRGTPFVMLALVALVSFGLAAPQLLPSVEMAQNTVRAAFAYERAAEFSLPPAQLIGLFVPGFFGRGAQHAWGPWERVEVGYIGVLPIILAMLALVLRRDAPTRFFGVFAALGLALALGGYAILHGWLYQFVPGFGQLRAPARFIVLFDFAIAALAAFGFDTLLRALPRASEIAFKRIARAAPFVFLLIALTAGATAYAIFILGQGQDAVLFARIANAANALAFFILLLAFSVGLIIARATRFFRPRVWAALALALILFDLFSLGAYVDISTDDPSRVFDHPNAVAFLKSEGGLFRIDPRGTGVDNVWAPDTSILYGLYDVGGDNPLVLADFDRYWESLGSRSTRAYDLLNVKYVIARKDVPLDREKFRLAFGDAPGFNVYENARFVPRAIIVFDARIVPDRSAALDAVRANDFDPFQVAIVERNVEPSAPTDSAFAQIVGYGPNEIALDVRAVGGGLLVLSEVYYPGWRAWVNDREVSVLRANYLFRAVALDAGASRVRLLYDPLSFKTGAGIFAVTTLALIGWFVWRRKK
jgi:hypothetical protein